jgi:5'-methylthioadenosine phosphorylase
MFGSLSLVYAERFYYNFVFFESIAESTGAPMTPSLAIIGGSAAYHLLQRGAWTVRETLAVDTPFGPVSHVQRIGLDGDLEAWFLSRHGQTRYTVSAPFVNYRANIYALKELGATRIVAWSGPGSLQAGRIHPGEFVLPDDILDQTRNRPGTFFAGRGWGFIRSHPTFCPGIREALRKSLAASGTTWHDGGVYVCTEGPRLETPAEIRAFARLGGDLVGMTLAPEAFLARELEMCYAPLCYVTNFAEGIVDRPVRPGELFGGMLAPEERAAVDRCISLFPELCRRTLADLAKMPRDCNCSQAMRRYREEGILGEDWRTWIGDR